MERTLPVEEIPSLPISPTNEADASPNEEPVLTPPSLPPQQQQREDSGERQPHNSANFAVSDDSPPAIAEVNKLVINVPLAVGGGESAVRADEESSAAHPFAGDEPDASVPGPLSMKDLFGALFEVQLDTDVVAADPALCDTRHILTSNFGESITEMDIDLVNCETLLEQEMQTNKSARHLAEVERIFGVEGLKSLLSDKIEAFNTLHATPPTKSTLGDVSKLWLMEMPKVAPNRQTMHADPQPFFQSTCEYLESNPRMLYTPSNVMRWAHHRGKDIFMSNSRVVRWSDGSVTLHVGSDVFSLQDCKGSGALNLLAKPTTVRKGDVALPAVVTAMQPDRHFVTEPTGAASVEHAVLAESVQNRAVATKLKLPFVAAPVPAINWARPRKDSRNLYEEYVATEYDQRQKLIERRRREGRPMSLAEQIALEAELHHHLSTTSADVLKEQQEDARRASALRSVQQQQQRAGARRDRFDRDLGLSAEMPAEYVRAGAEVHDSDSSENNESGEDRDDDDFETAFEEMYRKRQREDEEVGTHTQARYEAEQSIRFAPLTAALEQLAATLPMGSDAHATVQGTLEYLFSGHLSADMIKKEIPVMLKEVTEDAPTVDTSAVVAVFSRIFTE